jgi:hypothetical protein
MVVSGNRHVKMNQIKNMKTNFLTAGAILTIAFYSSISAKAGEPLLSPRARANEIQVWHSTAKDPDLLANRPVGNAKAWAALESFRTVPSSGPSIDLAHSRPNLAPKDPRYETAARELAISQFQVAPLK